MVEKLIKDVGPTKYVVKNEFDGIGAKLGLSVILWSSQ